MYRGFFCMATAIFIAGCSGQRSQTYDELMAAREQANPVGRWQSAGILKDGDIIRVYVMNSRTGLVCEHEFSNGADAGSRARDTNCTGSGDNN